MSDTARTIAVSAALTLVAVLVLVSRYAGPGRADGPSGTVVLERLLAAFDMADGTAGEPRPGATFLVRDDQRSRAEARAVVEHVRDGGRLVLADPRGAIATELGIDRGDRSVALTPVTRLPVRCDRPEAAGVTEVATLGGDPRLELRGPAGPVEVCLGEDGSPYAVRLQVGDGVAIVLGGASPLTNELIVEADTARFVLQALGGPGTPVVTGTPRADPDGPPGPLELAPPAVRWALAGLAVAALVLVATRWRRLGRPLDEPDPAEVPASALVDAVAGLYRAAGDRAHVAEQLRRRAAADLAARLGLGAAATPAEVVTALADRGGRTGSGHDLDARPVRELLDGSDPSSDADLLELARGLTDLRDALAPDPARPTPADRPDPEPADA